MENMQTLLSSLFNEDKSDVFGQLFHSCADEICGYPGPTYRMFMNNMDWSQEDFENVRQLICTLLRNPACLYLNEEKMPPEYREFSQPVQQKILSYLKVRRENLVNALIKDYSKRKAPVVVDFDWRLKLIMGSSKMASLREPLLQLDLILEKPGGEDVLAVELNKEELDTLINTIESIVR